MPTVLVVDDDDIVLRILQKTLAASGIKHIAHASPEAALKTLERQPIHVLLTDLVMTDLDGIELFLRGRHQQPLLRGICISAHLDYDRMTAIVEAGFDDCLLKPVRRTSLLEAVLHSLSRRGLWQDRLAELRGVEHQP